MNRSRSIEISCKEMFSCASNHIDDAPICFLKTGIIDLLDVSHCGLCVGMSECFRDNGKVDVGTESNTGPSMSGCVGGQTACDSGLFCQSLKGMVVSVEHQQVFIVCLLGVVRTE